MRSTAILEGRRPPELTGVRFMRGDTRFPLDWEEQRRALRALRNNL